MHFSLRTSFRRRSWRLRRRLPDLRHALQLPLLVGTVLMPFFVTLHVGGEDERVARLLHNVLPLLTLAWAAACAFRSRGWWVLFAYYFWRAV